MKRVIDLLKAIALGGFGVLFPLLLFYILLVEILELVVAMASPITDAAFPPGYLEDVEFPIMVLLAVVLILLVSLLIGAVMRSQLGNRLGDWIERNSLGRLPLYKAAKFLSRGITGTEHFRPAVLKNSDTEWEIVYIIEDHGNGKLTVMLPWVPASIAGSVKIVSRDRVEMLNVNLGQASAVLSQWGVGVRDMMNKGKTE